MNGPEFAPDPHTTSMASWLALSLKHMATIGEEQMNIPVKAGLVDENGKAYEVRGVIAVAWDFQK